MTAPTCEFTPEPLLSHTAFDPAVQPLAVLHLFLAFSGGIQYRVCTGPPFDQSFKDPPKEGDFAFGDVAYKEMEIIVSSLQHSKLQISDCVKQPPVSMCTFLNAASTCLGQKDEASNLKLFI